MVEHVTIRGEKYPVRIGYYVMKKVKEETGMSFSDALKHIREEEKIDIHETILHAALEMGAYEETGSMDIDITKDEMPMVLDSCFAEYLELFTSDTFFPKALREAAKNGEQMLEENKSPKRTKKPQEEKT